MNRKDAIIGIGALLASCSSGTPINQLPRAAFNPPSLENDSDLREVLARGGSIKLPARVYKVSGPPLTMPPGTTVRGAGIDRTIIKYTGKSHLLVDSDGVSISDLAFDGSLCPKAPFNSFNRALVFLQGRQTTLLRVRIQSAPSFGAFVYGGSPIIRNCHFDDCGRTNGQDSLGADHSRPPGVVYESNKFTNCHGNAIDNCTTSGTWARNSVLSVAQSIGSLSGDIIADGGSTAVTIQNNLLVVGSIKVYGATPGCLEYHGKPHGCRVIANVIKIGKLCKTADCNGLYVIPGNRHHGNIVNGKRVD